MSNSKISLERYQTEAQATDKFPAYDGDNTMVPILGFSGELGSLASVLKKRIRDGESYSSFSADAAEELGDILWYLANLATKVKINFNQVALEPIGNSSQKDALGALKKLLNYEIANETLIKSRANSNLEGLPLFNDILNQLNLISHWLGSSLEEIAFQNLSKVKLMWLPDESPAPLRDVKFDTHERLPRNLSITFIQQKKSGKASVLMRIDNAFNVGDRLTDNSYEDDGYRFHDIFHWSYAAVLGWSPIIRSVLNQKRKSDPGKDEVEDGARAKIIEEAVSIYIFNYAKRHEMLKKNDIVDRGIIKYIRGLVSGLEVENAHDWEWQRAISKGYKVFNEVRDILSKGDRDQVTIEFSADKRDIWVKK